MWTRWQIQRGNIFNCDICNLNRWSGDGCYMPQGCRHKICQECLITWPQSTIRQCIVCARRNRDKVVTTMDKSNPYSDPGDPNYNPQDDYGFWMKRDEEWRQRQRERQQQQDLKSNIPYAQIAEQRRLALQARLLEEQQRVMRDPLNAQGYVSSIAGNIFNEFDVSIQRGSEQNEQKKQISIDENTSADVLEKKPRKMSID